MTASVLEQRSTASGWDRLRLALVVAWLVVLASALLLGERPSSRQTLDQALGAGGVQEEVRVVGGLPPGASGTSLQEVHWRDGVVRRWYQVRQVDDGSQSSGGVPVSTQEIGRVLEQTHPGLRVVRADRPSVGASIGDWRVPGWTGALALAAGLLSLGLLIGGPEPWRATRWAWFWLLSSPFGLAAFLLLSGPTPLLPGPKDPRRRLTGGWAFLLAGVLGGGTTSLS